MLGRPVPGVGHEGVPVGAGIDLVGLVELGAA